MLFKYPSLHSPTTGLTERTSSLPGAESVYVTCASAAMNALSVLVNTIGVSSRPSSSTCVAPMSFPKPLPTTTAAGVFC